MVERLMVEQRQPIVHNLLVREHMAKCLFGHLRFLVEKCEIAYDKGVVDILYRSITERTDSE